MVRGIRKTRGCTIAGLRETKRERARAYILAHQDESKEDQARGSGLSLGTIATARKELVADGLIPPSRKNLAKDSDALSRNWRWRRPPPATAPDKPVDPGDGGPPLPPARPHEGATVLDHDAMVAMASSADLMAAADASDEEVLRRLQRQYLRFAFDPNLHPDTRMSASQMWHKSRDQAKQTKIGPGAPVTRADAVDRLEAVLRPLAADVVLEAIGRVFKIEEAAGGEKADEAPVAVGTQEAPPPA